MELGLARCALYIEKDHTYLTAQIICEETELSTIHSRLQVVYITE